MINLNNDVPPGKTSHSGNIDSNFLIQKLVSPKTDLNQANFQPYSNFKHTSQAKQLIQMPFTHLLPHDNVLFCLENN